jgi:hypothetical protein
LARSIAITSLIAKFFTRLLSTLKGSSQEEKEIAKRIKSPMNSADQIKFMFDLEEETDKEQDEKEDKEKKLSSKK